MSDTDGGKNEAARWSRLLRWLEDKHGMNANQLVVEARSVEGAGRGLFATQSCPPSTVLFTMPKNALMNLNTLRPLYPQSTRLRLSAVQIISLHLLLHRPTGEEDSLDPAFGPYISTLPRDFTSHPLTWLASRKAKHAAEEIFLRNLPPNVTDGLHTLYARFLEDYQTICIYLNQHPRVLDTSSRPNAEFPKPYGTSPITLVTDYCWAWLNVNTRSIYYPIQGEDPEKDCLTLCPILDFANHNEAPSHITPAVETALRSPGSHASAGDFTFTSCIDTIVEAGQQLYLRYGGHSNRMLFAEYGFVNQFGPEAIPRGEFRGEVDVQDIVEECIRTLKPRYGGRREASAYQRWVMDTLEEEGYWGDWTLDSSPSPAHPSYRLITALRLIQIAANSDAKTGAPPESETQAWRDVLSGRRELISDENESGWREVLLGFCERISGRAQEGRDQATQDLANLEGWQAWMRENILYLWREELEVADAVARSIRAGEVF